MSDEKRLQSTLDKIYNILTKIEMNTTKLQKDVHKLQKASTHIDVKNEDDGK